MNILLLAASASLAASAQPSSLVLSWSEGAVHRVITAPGRVTDIVLEPGEVLVGEGAVAAGDTARWIIGQSESGAGPARRAHVLVKPTASGLSTNLIINTDRRSYRLELHSTSSSYTASVMWRYPESAIVALRAPKPSLEPKTASRNPPVAAVEQLNFSWKIEGRAPWRPERVFDDGQRVVIDFPAAATQLPPLYERAAKGDALQLLNYRVVGRRIVVDRLFARGELVMGAGKGRQRVALERAVAP